MDIINSALTIISIGCTIYSVRAAKRAKSYQEEAIRTYKAIDARTVIGKFRVACSNFQQKTLDNDWYKGISPTDVISPFTEALKSLGKVYESEKDEALKEKVHILNGYVRHYERATSKVKKECDELILDISDILYRIDCKIISESVS